MGYMQHPLNTIREWSHLLGLKISAAKTKPVIFTLRLTNQPLPSKIDENEIHYTGYAKFLGINFVSKLNWTHHIKEL